jgi:hypothetical protein
MATVDKEIAEELIKNKGIYFDDPPAALIVEYTNAWGGTSYGLTYMSEGDPHRYLRETQYVRNPKVLWKNAALKKEGRV